MDRCITNEARRERSQTRARDQRRRDARRMRFAPPHPTRSAYSIRRIHAIDKTVADRRRRYDDGRLSQWIEQHTRYDRHVEWIRRRIGWKRRNEWSRDPNARTGRDESESWSSGARNHRRVPSDAHAAGRDDPDRYDSSRHDQASSPPVAATIGSVRRSARGADRSHPAPNRETISSTTARADRPTPISVAEAKPVHSP